MKVRFTNLLRTTFSQIAPCCNGAPAAGEDIPTPNMNGIVVISSFFQHRFFLSSCNFFRVLLDHYKIKLVYLNPNSVIQIAVFVHLYKAILEIPLNVPLPKNYFFLKY
jgi:hypothetical protein